MQGTRHYRLTVGQAVRNHNGSDYICRFCAGPDAYVMERVKDGWTLTAHVITMYQDGTIEWDYSTDGRWPG